MAEGKITNLAIKTIHHTFNDLTQYSPSGYYLYIRNIHSTLGIPSTAKLINASLAGWSGLGTTANVQLIADDAITVFFTYEYPIANTSYVTVRFAYI